MSLLVWLPLNGNLLQQGLSGVNATMMGTGITYSAGKIGLAATFPNNCNSCIYLPRMRLLTGTYAAWIKVIGAGATSRLCIISEGRDSYNDGVEFYTSQAGTSLSFKAHEKVITTTIVLNQWYHVAGTFGNGKVKLYVNGELKGTLTYTADMTYQYALDLVLGKMSYSYTNTSNYFSFNGLLNDVRIYDHALSAKEVEEISKGLVLHYKLDNNGLGNPNLVKGNYSAITTATTNNVSGTLSFDTSIMSLNDLKGKTLYFSYDYSVEGAKLYNNTGDYTKDRYGIHGSLSYIDSSGTTKTTYPFAGYLTASGTGRAILSYIIPADAQLINSLTFGLQPFNKPAANSTATWYIKNCKLEIGQVTSYTPNLNDMHQNSSIIYDSSGYNNNGTIVGPLEATTPSSRYSCATKFDGVTSCIKIPYNEINPDRIFTVNLWFYKDALGSKGYETLFGGPSGFEMDTRAGSATNLSLYMASVRGGSVYSPLNLNEWTMITMARDGTNEFYYVNGELKKTIEAKSMPSGLYRIGAWASDTGLNYYGEISDFRIYASALTEEQIKELYNTSMTIDNNGNIHARELVEQ